MQLRPSAAVILAAALAAAGCGREGGGEAAPAMPQTRETPAREAGVSSWSAERIARDPQAYIAAATAEADAMSARLRPLEANLQQQLQSANRNIAALKNREREARAFWRAAKPLYDDSATSYPAFVAGRQFASKNSLMHELLEAKRTVESTTNAVPKLENNAASIRKTLDATSAKLAENARLRADIARKTDAILAAAAAKDLKEIAGLSASLFGDVEAALPDEKLFAPSVDLLGDDGGASELDGVSL